MPLLFVLGTVALSYLTYRLLQNNSNQGIHGVVIIDTPNAVMLLNELYPRLAQFRYHCSLIADYNDIDGYEIMTRYNRTTQEAIRAFDTIKNTFNEQFSETTSLDWWHENLTYHDITIWRLWEISQLFEQQNLTTFYKLPGNITYRIPHIQYRIDTEILHKLALQYNYTIKGYDSPPARNRRENWYFESNFMDNNRWVSLSFADNPLDDYTRMQRRAIGDTLSELSDSNRCILSASDSSFSPQDLTRMPNKEHLIYLISAASYDDTTQRLEKIIRFNANVYTFNITNQADAKHIAEEVEQKVRASYRRKNFFSFFDKTIDAEQSITPFNMTLLEDKIKAQPQVTHQWLISTMAVSQLSSNVSCAAITLPMLLDVSTTCLADSACLSLLEEKSPVFNEVSELVQRLRIRTQQADILRRAVAHFDTCAVFSSRLYLKKRLADFNVRDIMHVLDAQYAVVIRQFFGNDYGFQPLRSFVNYLEVLNDMQYMPSSEYTEEQFREQITPVVVISLQLQNALPLAIKTLSLEAFLHEQAEQVKRREVHDRKAACYARFGLDSFGDVPKSHINIEVFSDCYLGGDSSDNCHRFWSRGVAKIACNDEHLSLEVRL